MGGTKNDWASTIGAHTTKKEDENTKGLDLIGKSHSGRGKGKSQSS